MGPFYLHLFGGDTDEVNDLNADRHYPSKWETVEINGMRYTKSWGPYADYTDFAALIRSVFTPRFWAERNTPGGIETFINIDGVLYYISAARGSGNYNENFPDKYRLLTSTLAPLWEMSLTAVYVAAVVFLLRLLLKDGFPGRCCACFGWWYSSGWPYPCRCKARYRWCPPP